MSKPGKKFSCVIWGGYARGNTGDELCLAAALESAQRQFGGPVAVLSPDPEFTSRLFPDVAVVRYVPPETSRSQRWKRFRRHCRARWQSLFGQPVAPPIRPVSATEWMQCLAESERLYLAGGGYLTDLFPLNVTLAPVQQALKLNLPVSTAPVGIGPFASDAWAQTVAALLRQMDLQVRDAVSLEFCRAREVPARLAPDDAFAWLSPFAITLPKKSPSASPRKIGVCIFAQYGQPATTDLSGWWIELLRGLNSQFPEHSVEGFCFHTSPLAEYREMMRLFAGAGLRTDQVRLPTLDFREAVRALGEYEFIISTRFHGVVTANVLGIPNVAIAAGDYYQSKMAAAVNGHETLSRLVSPERTTPCELLDLCREKLDPKPPANTVNP
jgi:polysaccharide pyruvyl transferase WcaK-like protein